MSKKKPNSIKKICFPIVQIKFIQPQKIKKPNYFNLSLKNLSNHCISQLLQSSSSRPLLLFSIQKNLLTHYAHFSSSQFQLLPLSLYLQLVLVVFLNYRCLVLVQQQPLLAYLLNLNCYCFKFHLVYGLSIPLCKVLGYNKFYLIIVININ